MAKQKKLVLNRAGSSFFKTKNIVSENLKFSNGFSAPQNAFCAKIGSSQGDSFVLFAFCGAFALFCGSFAPFFTKNSH
ncbi:MAG: hypothetical protein IJ837_03905 [Clostridia bacterium]|nr:hypothetical protein [Clostridia bacterium]